MDIVIPDDKVENIFRHPLVSGLLDHSSDGVLVIDVRKRRILHINKRAQTLLGYTGEDVVGCACKEIARSPACQSSCPLSALLQDPDTSQGELDLFYRDSADALLHAHTRMLVVRGPDGEPLAGIEMFRDLNLVRHLESALKERRSLGSLVGRSPAMQHLYDLVSQVAPYDLPTLLMGEAGVGKELLADTLQALGPRSAGPYVKVSCAALGSEAALAELYGRGGDADREPRPGRVEEAHGGTLLLQGIDELPMDVQGRLLRLLEDGTIERVGEDLLRRVDVRVLATSTRCLQEAVARGRFRQDLFYRLASLRLELPPLRERSSDIPLLAEHLLARFAAEARSRGAPKEVAGLTEAATAWLVEQDWPGNLRELENVLRIGWIRTPEGEAVDREVLDMAPPPPPSTLCLADLEKRAISEAMDKTEGNLTAAAKLLGIDRSTLWRKLKKASD